MTALGGTNAYAPGMRVGYSSDVAISVEEMDALEADLSVSSLVVVALEIAVLVLYFRWWRAIAVLLPPLLLATVYAFGLASLPPANVTELNSNTAFLASIIVGNGINVGIVLLARYREARRQGLGVEEALAVGVWGARLGTLAAAFAAAASYASLLLTEFRGFRQFGVIGGAGMVASWVTAFVLIPPLVKWLDRDEAAVLKAEKTGPGIMGRVVTLVERWPVPIVAGALALSVVSAFAVSRFDRTTQMEHDFSKLRRVDTWEHGDGYWGRKVDNLLGRYLTPTVVLTDSVEQAKAAEKTIRDSVDHGALKPLVASVRSADDVLPTEQDAKLAVVADIRDALTPKIRSLIEEDRRKKLDRVPRPGGPRAARGRATCRTRSPPGCAKRTGRSAGPSSSTRDRATRSGKRRPSTPSSRSCATPAGAWQARSRCRTTSSPPSAGTHPSRASRRSWASS